MTNYFVLGSLTALSIAEISLRAKKDKDSRKWSWLPAVLNVIWPAFVLHFMANFRGMYDFYNRFYELIALYNF
jgi:hypothetical protein